MAWLKDVIIDVAVTLLIILAATLGVAWAWWLIAIYTPLMLLMKALFLLAGNLLPVKRSAAQAPAWFFHLLYAINLTALLLAGWWMLAGAWLLIWILSAAAAMRARPRLKTT